MVDPTINNSFLFHFRFNFIIILIIHTKIVVRTNEKFTENTELVICYLSQISDFIRDTHINFMDQTC